LRWRGARVGERSGGGECGCGRGPASAVGPEMGRRPVKVRNRFSFLNKISDFYNLILIQILKMKKTFSQIAPKTKVVQNFILYNFHLGHFSKF
jgi:hypothetical protein